MIMFCTKCGASIPEGATVCPSCNAPLAEKAAPATPPKKEKAPKAAKPPKPPKPVKIPPKQSVPARVFCVLLSILLCLALLIASVLTILRVSLSGDELSQWVGDVNVSEISVSIEGKEVTLSEYLYDISEDRDLGLSKRDISDLLEDDLVKEFLSSATAQYQQYLTDGSGSGVDTDMILDFIEDHENDIKDAILSKTSYEWDDLTFHYDTIKEQLDEQLGDTLSVKQLNAISGNALSLVRLSIMPVTIILAWLLCALLALGLILMNLHRASSLLFYIGIPVLIIGVALCLMGLACLLVAFIVPSLAFILDGNPLVASFRNLALIIGGVMLVAGILMTVVHNLIRKSEKTRLAAVSAPADV